MRIAVGWPGNLPQQRLELASAESGVPLKLEVIFVQGDGPVLFKLQGTFSWFEQALAEVEKVRRALYKNGVVQGELPLYLWVDDTDSPVKLEHYLIMLERERRQHFGCFDLDETHPLGGSFPVSR